MSGQLIEFSTSTANQPKNKGYLAIPESGKGPAVIVLQEWWGLVDHIKEICDRFAQAGFVALAPDLYQGESTDKPDHAGRLMMALNIEQTERDLNQAIEFLLAHESTTSSKVGTVGFCMGGQLSLFAACVNSKVGACVNYYGIHPDVKPNLKQLAAPVLGFFAEKDESVPPAAAKQLESDLKAAGKEAEIHIYEGADHAFFNNTRPEVYHAEYAQETWQKMLQFYKKNLS